MSDDLKLALLCFGVIGGVVALLWIAFSWRVQRSRRTRTSRLIVDTVVVASSMEPESAPGGRVWVSIIVEAVVPNGKRQTWCTSVKAHPSRVAELGVGAELRGRLDPLHGEADGYDYIQLEVDAFRQEAEV